MRYNTGRIDRTLRIVVALIIMSVGFYYQSLWGTIGIIPLISGITGFCPLYSIFDISTCHYRTAADKSERLQTKS